MKAIESWERHHLPFVTWKELRLLPNETIKEFMISFTPTASPLIPWVKLPLAIGDAEHLVDSETGLSMPYDLAAGYELKVIRYWASVDQPILGNLFFDTMFINNAFYQAGGIYYEQEIEEITSKWFDPIYAFAHTLDFTGYNAGHVEARGTVIITALLIDHGSDPTFERKTKKVRCPICGDIQTVPYDTTKIVCGNGHKFIVKYFPWGGSL